MSSFEQRKLAHGGCKQQRKDKSKAPPSNLDAERIVCATFMAHNKLFEDYSDRLKPDDFCDPMHRQVMSIGIKLVVENKPANNATIASQITELSPIPDLTVDAYLRKLNAYIKGRDEVEAYVQEVKLSAKRRDVLELSERFGSMAPTAGHDVIDQLSSAVALLAGGARNQGMVHLGKVFDATFQDIMARDKAGFGPTGLLSGFPEIDDAIGGFKKAKLYYFVAMEKVGKSALALSVARRFLHQDVPVAIFSLEMKAEEITERLLTMEAGINTVNRKQGQRLTDDESVTLSEATDRCSSWKLYCNDLASLTPSAIVMNSRHAVKVHGAKAIIVDYIQIVNAEEGEKDDTRKRVEKASRTMARMAKELDIPVICLAQLNRKAVERGSVAKWDAFDANSARPRRGDIRETAQIEMDADAVIAIYRPEILFKELRPFEDGRFDEEVINYENKLRDLKGKAELSVLVNRSGPGGVRCNCRYIEELALFEPKPRKM